MGQEPGPAGSVRSSLVAGAASGLAAFASFAVFHSIWIFPTAGVFADGPIIGGLAGLAVGWAYHRLRQSGGLPDGGRGGLLLGAVLWVLLVPYELFGVLFGPFTHLARPVEFAAFAPAMLIGAPLAAALGWWLTREARATVALTVATLVVHFMIGGSLVFFGGRATMLDLFLWMLPTYLGAGLVLVGVRGTLVRRAGSTSGPVTPAE